MNDLLTEITNALDCAHKPTKLVTSIDVARDLKQSDAFLKYGTQTQNGDIIIFGLLLVVCEFLPSGKWYIK